jgi:hypothetical protein
VEESALWEGEKLLLEEGERFFFFLPLFFDSPVGQFGS